MLILTPRRLTHYLACCLAALLITQPLLAEAPPEPSIIDDITLSNPYVLTNKATTTYLKIGLTGGTLPNTTPRTGVNVALVIDRSGSMSGEKLKRAKESALLAVDLLSSDDILSVVTYEDNVEVVVPATKLSDKNQVRSRISSIRSAGSTALYAGVQKGGEELKKFLSSNRINRVVLISDGLANVGPSSASELGTLGATLAGQGISVSTVGLGLGYNEDLMVSLAQNSDGNHTFAENSSDLARIFRDEFEDVLTVVAQNIDIKVVFSNGIKPLRVLGRTATITDNQIQTSLSQVYSQQEKYLLVEVAVPSRPIVSTAVMGSIGLSYHDMQTQTTTNINRQVVINYTDSAAQVEQYANKPVQVAAVEQLGTLMAKEAVRLRDAGKPSEARAKLEEAASYYRDNAVELEAPALTTLGNTYADEAETIENDAEWNRSRKDLKAQQYQTENQYKNRK